MFALFHGNAHGLEAMVGWHGGCLYGGLCCYQRIAYCRFRSPILVLRTQVQRWLVPALGGGISLVGMWLLLAQ